MFGSEIAEIAVGIVFVFLLLSLTASTMREAAEGLLKSRAIQLERGLREMLDDPSGEEITSSLFEHPLLNSLFPGSYQPATQLRNYIIPRRTLVPGDDGSLRAIKQQRLQFNSNLPAYIPSRNFALALLDLASRKSGADILSLDAVRQSAVTLNNPRLRQALLVAVGESDGSIDRARTSLEAWFDGTMDRVSGWYKSETQWVLFAIGVGLAVTLNVDCLHVADALSRNNTLRQSIIQTVEKQQGSLAPGAARDQVDGAMAGLSGVIGWPQFEQRIDKATRDQPATNRSLIWWQALAGSLPGWLISAFAVSLGAPFWFDVLNRLMIVRSTVKPYEKSAARGSDEGGTGPTAAALLAPPRIAAVAADPPATAAAPVATSATDITVAIRLAFDTGIDALEAFEYFVDDVPHAVPPDHLVETELAVNVAHVLSARAQSGGRTLAWSATIKPGLDDDGWPMLVTLA